MVKNRSSHGSQAAEAVKLLLERRDIAIYVVGIGETRKASPIPKRDTEGNITGYEITEDGETIYTKPNPAFLRRLPKWYGGTYQHDATGDELKHIFAQVIEKHKNIIGVKKKTIIRDVSQYFLGVLGLLALYFFL